MRAGQFDIFRAIGFIAGAIPFHIHFIRNIEPDLIVFDGACGSVLQIPFPQRSECCHGRRRSEREKPFIEVTFHSVFRDDGTTRVLGFCPFQSHTGIPS